MEKYRLKLMVIILGVLFSFSGLVSPVKAIEVNEKGEVIEHYKNGTINWTTRRLEAVGIAESEGQTIRNQIVAAKLLARANLLKVPEGIRIRGDYGVLKGINSKEIVVAELNGFLKNSKVEEPVKNKWGLMQVTAYVYIDKTGNTILMPEKVVFKTDTASFKPPADIPSPPAIYTGLIIDARGMGLRPAMLPRILVEGDLSELYGSMAVDRETALRIGFAGYAGTMEKARSIKKRIGENPLEISAKSAFNTSDVVVSQDDARQIASAIVGNNFLKQCKVVIVLN